MADVGHEIRSRWLLAIFGETMQTVLEVDLGLPLAAPEKSHAERFPSVVAIRFSIDHSQSIRFLYNTINF